MNSELIKVSTWFRGNRSWLNVSKTHSTLFKNEQSINTNPPFNIFIDNMKIDQKVDSKFLSITVDEELNCNCHIDNVMTSVSGGVVTLHKISSYISQRTSINVYN